MALRPFVKQKILTSLLQTPRRFQTTCHQDVQTCGESAFVGRDFIDPTDFTPKELRELVWTALDMKCIMKNRKCVNFELLAGKTVTLLMSRPCIKTQIAYPSAAAMLGATCNVCIEKNWEQSVCVPDLGRFLATQSDLIFSFGDHHEMTCSLANGSKHPVLCVYSGKLAPIKALTDIMTIFEHYGRLKKLKMAYVGPLSPLLNTYMLMLPKFRMDLNFVTKCQEEAKPQCASMLNVGLKMCKQHNTSLKECSCVEDAIFRSDIISTVPHTLPGLEITLKDLNEASLDWVLLHSLPRTSIEVATDVFYDKRSLAFLSAANTVWVVMALMLRMSLEYKPKIKEPDFDGDMYSVC